jgi:TP901 family phage tail tape measure protein
VAISTLKLKLTLDADGFKAETQGLLINATTMALGFNQVTQAVRTVIDTAIGLSAPFREAEGLMANVASLGVGNIGELNTAIQELGADVGVPLSNLRGGLYDVVSAGVDASNQIDVLEASAKAAKAGLAETSDALNLGSAVIKGYGKDWGEFNTVMDMAFQTVKLGQTTFPQLSSAIGLVTPLASSLKIEMDELFGVMATGTGVTGTASEVATQLRAIMTYLAQPTQEMTDLMRQKGYATVEAAVADQGLTGILKILGDATGGSAAEMTKFFGSIEATNLALALSGGQYDTLIEKTQAMQSSAGAMTDAFDIQNQTLDSQVQMLQNQWAVVMEKSMGVLVPFASGLLELAGAAIDTRSEMTKFKDEMDEVNRNLQDLSNVDNLISRYEDLTAKGLTRTAEETQELKDITAQLATTYPGAISAVNQFGEATAVNSQKIKLMADQQRALWQTQNADLMQDQNDKLLKNIEILDGGASRVNGLMYRLAEFKESYNSAQATPLQTAEYAELQIQVQAAQKALVEANKEINTQIATISTWVDIADPEAVTAFGEAQNYNATQMATLRLRIEEYLTSLGDATDNPPTIPLEPTLTDLPKDVPPLSVPIKPVMDEVETDGDVAADFFAGLDQSPFLEAYQAEVDSYKLLLDAKQIDDQTYYDWRLALYDEMAQEALTRYGVDSDAYLTALSQKYAAESEHAAKLKELQDKQTGLTKISADTMRKSILSTYDAVSGAAAEWFGMNKAIATANAIVNTYEGITAALKNPVPVLKWIEVAATAAKGWASVAAIQSQGVPKMAGGGPLDSTGRVITSGNFGSGENRLFIGNSGEFLVNANATAQNMELLNNINNGVSYRPAAASGGSSLDSAMVGQIIAERLSEAMEKVQINVRSELDAMKFFRDNAPKYEKDKAARTLS